MSPYAAKLGSVSRFLRRPQNIRTCLLRTARVRLPTIRTLEASDHRVATLPDIFEPPGIALECEHIPSHQPAAAVHRRSPSRYLAARWEQPWIHKDHLASSLRRIRCETRKRHPHGRARSSCSHRPSVRSCRSRSRNTHHLCTWRKRRTLPETGHRDRLG